MNARFAIVRRMLEDGQARVPVRRTQAVCKWCMHHRPGADEVLRKWKNRSWIPLLHANLHVICSQMGFVLPKDCYYDNHEVIQCNE
jgi:hypothetical protein